MTHTAERETAAAFRRQVLEEAALTVEAIKTGDRHTRAAFTDAAQRIRALKGPEE